MPRVALTRVPETGIASVALVVQEAELFAFLDWCLCQVGLDICQLHELLHHRMLEQTEKESPKTWTPTATISNLLGSSWFSTVGYVHRCSPISPSSELSWTLSSVSEQSWNWNGQIRFTERAWIFNMAFPIHDWKPAAVCELIKLSLLNGLERRRLVLARHCDGSQQLTQSVSVLVNDEESPQQAKCANRQCLAYRLHSLHGYGTICLSNLLITERYAFRSGH